MNPIRSVLYLNQSHDPLNVVYAKGLQKNGVEVLSMYFKASIRDFFRLAKFYKNEGKKYDLIIVGTDSPHLVFFMKLISDKTIIYNAPLSTYERMIVSRNLAPKFSIKAFYYWLLGFMVVHFADLTLLESNHQVEYFKKVFKASPKKLFRAWVGLDDDNFFYNPAIKKFDDFTVLFRGALLPEAGGEYAVKAAKILENKNIKFIMICYGMFLEQTRKLIGELKPSNLTLVTSFPAYSELREIMQKCHISLGQLSDHVRLTRTIPNKAYESLAMRLPYLTAANSGILELLTPNETCLTFKPADVESLAEKILWARDNYQEADRIAQNGYELYQNKLRSDILARDLLDKLNTIV